ncbi:MAG: hypothetical protein ACYCZU_01635 [Devosia sp.]
MAASVAPAMEVQKGPRLVATVRVCMRLGNRPSTAPDGQHRAEQLKSTTLDRRSSGSPDAESAASRSSASNNPGCAIIAPVIAGSTESRQSYESRGFWNRPFAKGGLEAPRDRRFRIRPRS